MKKFLITFFTMIAVPIALFCGSIKVSTSAAGGVLCLGRTCSITWTSTGIKGKVRVELVRGGLVVAAIARETENSGHIDFTVPNKLQAGRYAVVVSALKGETIGTSESFRIDPCTLTALPVPPPQREIAPQISVTAPERAHAGGYILVRWTTLGRVPSPLTISLHPPGCPESSRTGFYLGTAPTNAGRALLRIPTSFPAIVGNEGQSLRVGPAFGPPYACSRVDVDDDLVVLAPTSGQVWHPGETVTIRWECRGYRCLLSLITIVRESEIAAFRDVFSFGRTLYSYRRSDDEYVASGMRRVTLPSDLSPGRYVVFLFFEAFAHLDLSDATCSDVIQVMAR